MMRQKCKVFELPIFESFIVMIYYKDYKYVNKILKRENFTYTIDAKDCGMVCSEEIFKKDKSSYVKYLIVIKADNDLNSLKNTIVHETLHLSQEILENKGIHFRKGGHNEPYTYLNSYLQGVIEDFIS